MCVSWWRSTRQLRLDAGSVPSWASVAVACSVIVWPTAKRCAAVGESIVTCGAVLPGSIRADATSDVAPPLSRTVSVLVNEPAAV